MDRSENMSRIRGRDTSPEVRLRHAVWRLGLRYRLNQRVVGVRPDFVVPRLKLAVFVDGCFWHGCPEHYVRPRSSTADFWASKLAQNVARDERQFKRLQAEGWCVVRVWEHEVEHNLTATAQFINDVALRIRPIPAERWAVNLAMPSQTAGQENWVLRDLCTGRTRQVSRMRGDCRRRKASDFANRRL
jgi:DNA mismatch endonuclease (patch repair protein)